MDINFVGLIGSLVRLIIVFKFDFKRQKEASVKNFGEEETKDIKVGSIAIIIFIIWGVITYAINW